MIRRSAHVYALTPNPALDISGHVKKVIPDEKNYVDRTRVDPGGNGINSARILKRLGVDVVALGFLGGGPGGQIKDLLEQEKIRCRFVSIRGETRVSVTVTNDGDHNQTRFTFPGPKISKEEIRQLHQQLENLRGPGILILGGSLPPALSKSFYLSVAKLAMRRGLGVTLDVPAKPLQDTLKQMKGRFLLLKPNQTELEEFEGKKLSDLNAVAKSARQMNRKAALVCVSLGEKGALFSTEQGCWLAKPPRVKVRGSVGAGDSTVGAIVAALGERGLILPEYLDRADEKDLLHVFKMGMAGGAATVSAEGTSLGEASVIRKLYRKIRVQRVVF